MIIYIYIYYYKYIYIYILCNINKPLFPQTFVSTIICVSAPRKAVETSYGILTTFLRLFHGFQVVPSPHRLLFGSCHAGQGGLRQLQEGAVLNDMQVGLSCHLAMTSRNTSQLNPSELLKT